MTRTTLHLFLRISAILLLGATAIYILTQTYFWLVSVWIFALVIILIWELARYLNRTRREVGEFLLSVSQNDFSSRSSRRNQPDLLDEAYETIRKKFSELRQDKATHYHFLQAVIEQVGFALIGYEKSTGNITVMNQAAKDLFNKPYIKTIKGLSAISDELFEKVADLHSGEEVVFKVFIGDRMRQLSITARELVLDNKPYKLVSFQDIQAALEARELESWQKLIRVLTHEIKNSAIPISTLSEVIHQIIRDNDQLRNLQELSDEEKEDINAGLLTISRRSKSLVNFVNAYGELTHLPTPSPVEISIQSLFQSTVSLMEKSMKKESLKIECISDPSHKILADQTQIEQILINLIKNASEALGNQTEPRIELRSGVDNERVYIEVSDNGTGMDEDTMEQIFIPFFSTKNKGSGIGLSLSRQIMRAHQGEIQVFSTPSKGTTFRLIF